MSLWRPQPKLRIPKPASGYGLRAMVTLVAVILLLWAPALSPAQTIKAAVGKQEIYIDSGTVTGGVASNVMDLNNVRFARHPDFERLIIDVQQLWERVPADKPSVFSVDYEQYPFRLVVTLDSVRFEVSAHFPDFRNSDYISGMYSLPAYDWGNVNWSIALKKPVKYEVYELHQPGRIVIDIKGGDLAADKFPPVYSLRTRSAEFNYKYLTNLEERLSEFQAKKVRILRSQNNKYMIEEGYYYTRQEARKRQKLFASKGIALFIEKRQADQIPGEID